MSATAYDAMNDALEQGAGLGYEMKPGFTTHWAMGSDALIELGHPELVHEWAGLFIERHQHYERPEPSNPIDSRDETDWRSALGDYERVGDWRVLFERELAERPWREVLVAWWPRLVFGCSAGLTHALIRTMHAVRAIDRDANDPTDLQLGELAMALSYWAGRYVEQPSARCLTGERRLPEVLESIPRLPADEEVGLRDKGFFLHMPDINGWGTAVEGLAPPDDVEVGFSELTLAFAQAQLAHPEIFPIPVVHTLTAPAAMRCMLAYLPEDLHLPSFVAAWQSCAALLSSFAQAEPAEIADSWDGEQPSTDELIENAVEHGDMHVIKLTEACLREHSVRADPRYLQLAARLRTQVPPFFRRAPQRA